MTKIHTIKLNNTVLSKVNNPRRDIHTGKGTTLK